MIPSHDVDDMLSYFVVTLELVIIASFDLWQFGRQRAVNKLHICNGDACIVTLHFVCAEKELKRGQSIEGGVSHFCSSSGRVIHTAHHFFATWNGFFLHLDNFPVW